MVPCPLGCVSTAVHAAKPSSWSAGFLNALDVQKNNNKIREVAFTNGSLLEQKVLVSPVKPHGNWRSLSYQFELCGEALPCVCS